MPLPVPVVVGKPPLEYRFKPFAGKNDLPSAVHASATRRLHEHLQRVQRCTAIPLRVAGDDLQHLGGQSISCFP